MEATTTTTRSAFNQHRIISSYGLALYRKITYIMLNGHIIGRFYRRSTECTRHNLNTQSVVLKVGFAPCSKIIRVDKLNTVVYQRLPLSFVHIHRVQCYSGGPEMFTFQFLQLQAQNFLLRVCQRCTYSSINCRAPFCCFPHMKTLQVFYQHYTEVFTDSSAALLRKLRNLESDFLKQLIIMLISSFVTNL